VVRRVRSCRALGGVLVLLAFLFPARVTAQDVKAEVTDDRTDPKKALRLSESLRATLTIIGPAPLRVELPSPLLDPLSDRDWKIQPVGTPAVAAAGEGMQRWSQTFRLDPYVTGESLPVIFARVKVNDREVQPGGFEVRVVSTVPEAKADAARPVTGIEQLPPPPEAPPVRVAPVWWVLGGLAAGFLLALVWRARRKAPPPSPREWAAAALDRLERDSPTPAAFVERAAGVLREFVERRFGIPAPKLTTAELLAVAREQAVWSVEEADALRGILDRCDRAKFAGDVPDDRGCRGLAAAVRDWVDHVSAAGPRPG
jgi:hypothetical protein